MNKLFYASAPVLFLLFSIGLSGNITAQNRGMLDPSLVAFLDTIYYDEQTPIRARDSLMRQYGAESEEAMVQQKIVKKNHAVNETKVRKLLDERGWPSIHTIGAQGSRTLFLVIQHSAPEIRVKYLPMMKEAVKKGDLLPRYLANVEDRVATDLGRLQVYGNQIKYYPETKTFDVWPIKDPANVDKRRASIGLGPIAVHLKNRFDLEWDLEKQIRRTAEFEAGKKN
jgi:hypothetical protein